MGAKCLQDTVMLGADYYETDSEMASLYAEGRVPIGIGENTRIKYRKSFRLPDLFLHLIKFFH